jgi:hypothetical protein
MRHTLCAATVCLVALAAVSGAFAQTGGIRVLVTASAGQPLPGARVTISHATGYVKATTLLTDAQGRVDFPVLRPGSGYAVEVAFPGFSTLREDDLQVRIADTLTLRLQMIEGLEEQVRVTAQRSVIDLEKAETSTKFSDDFIADLPVPSRYYQNILTLAPGVQDANEDGNPNVHGSRSRDFQALVGNVSNVDPLTGQWMSRVNPNSIEEIEIVAAGAGVEFGRAQGGYARILQKQGSNQHEGVSELYWTSSELDGPGGDHRAPGPEPEFDTYQAMLSFSGPILRDRLWYRLSWERRDREDPRATPGGTALFTEQTETRDALLTWQVSPRNKLALHYLSDPREAVNVGIGNLTPPESGLRQDRDVETYGLTWTAPYSPRVLVESTLAWQDLNTSQAPATRGVVNDCTGLSQDLFLQDALCHNLTTDFTSGSYYRTEDDHRQRLTVKSQATVYGGRLWGASHQFKVGLAIENERYFRQLSRGPSVTFEVINEDEFGNPFINPRGLAIARMAVPDADDVRATGNTWGLYAEDQLKPLSNLTLTLGARVDREEITSSGRSPFDPSAELAEFERLVALCPPPGDIGGLHSTCRNAAWAASFTGFEDFVLFDQIMRKQLCASAPDQGNCEVLVSESIATKRNEDLLQVRRKEDVYTTNTNVSPFLSLAWSPWSDGKTAFKAATGRHYNNIPLLIPLQEVEPILTDIQYDVDLDTQHTTREKTISPTVNTITVERGLRTPYQDELTLSIERELWTETSLQLTWIDRRYRDQIQDVNINVATGDLGRCKIETGFDPYPVVASPGTGTVTDPYTEQEYRDTDPGPGDGRIDDCAGQTVLTPGGIAVARPDGTPDLYLQNPFWGDILLVGNFNEIDYEAFVIELVRRHYRSWEMNASYTWSKAEGNGDDFFQELGNDPSLRTAVPGFQSYDQRHVAKLNATTVTPWGIRLGTTVVWQSGVPYSELVEELAFDTLPPSTQNFGVRGGRVRQTYPSGVRNDQRNPAYWNINLRATKEIALSRGTMLQLSAEVFNLLDDESYLIYNRDFERGQQLDGTNEAFRRFGRQWQLGMRLAF